MAKTGKNKSQIATIIVFIIAVIFLFTLISINLGRIAQKKTGMDNVVDGVGLQLASQLGSMGNALKHEFELWEGKDPCEWNWQLSIGLGILLAAVLVIVGCLTAGVGSAAILGFLGSAAGLSLLGGTAILIVSGAVTNYISTNPGAVEQLKIKFQNLSAFQQIIELPMQGAIFGLVDDPTWVPDTTDLDRNPNTASVPRLFKWYNIRLNTVPRAGTLVQNFYKDGLEGNGAFFRDSNGQPRFFIDENENLLVKPGKDSVRWWVDFDSDAKATRELKIVPWIKDELIPMLRELRNYGYGINVNRDLSIDDKGTYQYEVMIGNWIYEIEEFENTIVRSLYNMDFDSAVQGLDVWVKNLKKNDGLYNDPIDWYGRLRYLKMRVDAFKDKLVERRDQIHTCVVNCKSRTGGCWEDNCENGPACASECVEPAPCNPQDTENSCCARSVDTKWTGCCGEWKSCGELCYTQCEPDRNKDENKCVAPLTGQKKWCCELTVLDPYKYPRGCRDNATIIEDYPNPITGVRHNAIWVLQKFVNDLQNLTNIIGILYDQAKDINEQSYDRMHETFYIWRDKVGVNTAEPQFVSHIVYVRLDGLNPRPQSEGGNDFKLPYPTRYSEWRWTGNYVCTRIERTDGDFTLTVARFDEDVAKKEDKGLGRFWRFRFGRRGMTPDEEKLVQDYGIIGDGFIRSGQYFEPRNKEALKDILRRYGIVTKVRVHYGPGVTKENQESVSAQEKNKDIYIMETSSGLD